MPSMNAWHMAPFIGSVVSCHAPPYHMSSHPLIPSALQQISHLVTTLFAITFLMRVWLNFFWWSSSCYQSFKSALSAQTQQKGTNEWGMISMRINPLLIVSGDSDAFCQQWFHTRMFGSRQFRSLLSHKERIFTLWGNRNTNSANYGL